MARDTAIIFMAGQCNEKCWLLLIIKTDDVRLSIMGDYPTYLIDPADSLARHTHIFI